MLSKNNFLHCNSKNFSPDMTADVSLDWQISIASYATKNLPSDMSGWCEFTNTCTY